MADSIRDPNEKAFTAPPKTKYQATRLVVHGGVSVAVALRLDNDTSRLTFDYVVLDPSGSDQSGNAGDQAKANAQKELLDSQGWTDSPLSLSFPKEVRVVGEEAVPNFQLPAVDKSEQKAVAGTPDAQLHRWFSSTLCLTENVPSFEVLSDGELRILQWTCGKDNVADTRYRKVRLSVPTGHQQQDSLYEQTPQRH